MIVVKYEILNSFVNVDKQVFTSSDLTDGAKALYGYLLGLPTGGDYSDTYLIKTLNISVRSLARRKAELAKLDLTKVEQVSPRVYILFVGRLDYPASLVNNEWKENNDV